MWSELLEPCLGLLQGPGPRLRAFAQELTHTAIHAHAQENVLWCDGDHGFNPYDFAELNLTRGREADDGAERILVKRCMTPFQWDTVLSHHLPERLEHDRASLALVIPFDRLYSTDELSDWEAEDYVRFIIRHLHNVSRRHRIPILLGVDMQRWWRTHPILAGMTHEGVDKRWKVDRIAGQWRIRPEEGAPIQGDDRPVTLLDFLEPEVPAAPRRPVPVPRLPAPPPLSMPMPGPRQGPMPAPIRSPSPWRHKRY